MQGSWRKNTQLASQTGRAGTSTAAQLERQSVCPKSAPNWPIIRLLYEQQHSSGIDSQNSQSGEGQIDDEKIKL